MNAIIAIVRANLRLFINERGNLFWVVIMPLMIVFALGLSIGSETSQLRVGVVGAGADAHPTARAIARDVARVDGVQVEHVASVDALRHEVSVGAFDGGWIVAAGSAPLRLQWVSSSRNPATGARQALEQAVRRTSFAQIGRELVVAEGAGADYDAARAQHEPTSVTVRSVGDDDDAAGDDIRAVLAAGQLSLFVFLTTLTGGLYLLGSRMLGVTRRMRAAPVSTAQIIVGEAAARFAIAAVQAAVIIVGCSLIFGVDWGRPLVVIALCAALALCGTGAAMLLAASSSNPSQATATAVLLGLALGALGGSMQPLEFFPDVMRTVAFLVTPHAWMNDAMWQVLTQGAGFADVWLSLTVLTSAGLVLLSLAAWALARTLR